MRHITPTRWAHPRACGADARPARRQLHQVGSSPRVRGRRWRRDSPVQPSRAHPRGCGAEGKFITHYRDQYGSSPRVRGRHRPRRTRHSQHRLIPAGAGQTRSQYSSPRVTRAHPRGCGADYTTREGEQRTQGSSPRVRGRLGSFRLGDVLGGSSPRVRGRRFTQFLQNRHVGLIPAGAGQTSSGSSKPTRAGAHPRGCGADRHGRGRQLHHPGLISAGAGQTDSRTPSVKSRRAHPRGCGADLKRGTFTISSGGSSPRVRGRPGCTCKPVPSPGLIPAGAGQTWLYVQAGSVTWAHPRGCGADQIAHDAPEDELGSSPRVRGRHIADSGSGPSRGLIPAGAGQTSVSACSGVTMTAHPRGCGADQTLDYVYLPKGGSSPRVRGRPSGVERGGKRFGLIPAGAGQTAGRRNPPTRPGAHPRGCGADSSASPTTHAGDGSSPRVRGRPSGVERGGKRFGLIPAGAGQTAGRRNPPTRPGAHPRGCGADVLELGLDHFAPGLIPAGAGQTV